MKESERIVQEYKDAYKAVHGIDVEVERRGGWYRISSALSSRFRLHDLAEMTTRLRWRLESDKT